MKRTELLLVGSSLAFLLLYLMGLPGVSLFFALTLSLTAVLYGYLGFAHLNAVRLKDLFKKEAYKELTYKEFIVAISAGAGMGLLLNYVLFTIMYWSVGSWFLFVGLSLLVLSTVLILVFRLRQGELAKTIFRKGGVVLAFTLLIYFLPDETCFSIRYRSTPSYVEAMKTYRENPTKENYELLDEVKREILKK
jgi:hypothetical protein